MAHIPTIDDCMPDRVREFVEKALVSDTKRPPGVIAVIATFGSPLFGYDTGAIAGTLPYMYMLGGAGGLNMTALEEGRVSGLSCIDVAAGVFSGGHLSDRSGRCHNITLFAIILLLGAIGCVIALNIWILHLTCAVLGFVVGGASAVVFVFLNETTPKQLCGPLATTDRITVASGQPLAFSMNVVIAHIRGDPTVTLTGDAMDVSGYVLGHAGASITWEAVQATVSIADVVGTGNDLTRRYMLALCSLPAIAL